MKVKKCKSCGHENIERANFCAKCGNKLVTVCNCWIKKKPYNCGRNKCPGYVQLLLETIH